MIIYRGNGVAYTMRVQLHPRLVNRKDLTNFEKWAITEIIAEFGTSEFTSREAHSHLRLSRRHQKNLSSVRQISALIRSCGCFVTVREELTRNNADWGKRKLIVHKVKDGW